MTKSKEEIRQKAVELVKDYSSSNDDLHYYALGQLLELGEKAIHARDKAVRGCASQALSELKKD